MRSKAALFGVAVGIVGIALLWRSLAAVNPNLQGDLNGDNKVTITDLSILLSNFNKNGSDGDVNGDGKVNITDLSILLSNWGKTYSGGGTTPPTQPPPPPPVQMPKPSTPTNIKAYTGGTSIGVRWNQSFVAGGIKQYDIYRDAKKIASVPAAYHYDFPEMYGNGYLDKTVAKGGKYSYQVQAVANNGETSALSTSVSATQPTSTTPTPTITYNLNGATDLEAVVRDKAIPFLKDWYPKIADSLAYPDYTPVNAIKITFDPAYTGVAYASYTSGDITVSTTWAKANQNDPQYMGMFLHESTHLIQASKNGPGWFNEGGADFSRDVILHDRDTFDIYPGRTDITYTAGYNAAAYFINWIQDAYKKNILRQFNIAGHNNTYADSMFSTATGKTVDQLWAEYLTKFKGPAGKVSGPGDLCSEVSGGTATNGTKLQLAACSGQAPQQWQINYRDVTQGKDGGFYLANSSKFCMDVNNNGTADGTQVWLYQCNGQLAQLWRAAPDGSLVSTSGKCLDTAGSATAAGTGLVIKACDGSATQKWTIPN